jgi:hypothetical protein
VPFCITTTCPLSRPSRNQQVGCRLARQESHLAGLRHEPISDGASRRSDRRSAVVLRPRGNHRGAARRLLCGQDDAVAQFPGYSHFRRSTIRDDAWRSRARPYGNRWNTPPIWCFVPPPLLDRSTSSWSGRRWSVKAEQIANFSGRQITPLLTQNAGSQFSTRIEGTCIRHRFGKGSSFTNSGSPPDHRQLFVGLRP